MSRRPSVIIVGGGFGGLCAAQALKSAPVDVTLIDRNNYHLFQPLLYQVATGSLRVTSTGADFSACAAHRPPNPPPTMMTLGRRLIDRPLVPNGFPVSVRWISGVPSGQSWCRSSDVGVR